VSDVQMITISSLIYFLFLYLQ